MPIDCHPPLGMAMLAAIVREKGHQVVAIDAFGLAPDKQTDTTVPFTTLKGYNPSLCVLGQTIDEIIDQIPADTEIIGISSMFSLNWPLDRLLLNIIAEKYPKATLISGGESITGSAEMCLKQVPALKATVLGEGEETLLELIDAIAEKRDLAEVKGLMFKNNLGEIIKTAPRNRVRQLNDLPFPAWDLMPVENYKRHPVIKGEIPRKTLAIMATRGCPYRCTFCTSPDMWGTLYLMRSPEHVLQEILWLYNQFGVNNFEFYDLTAIIKKDWIIEFAKLKIATGLDITWKIPAGTRSEAIDEEVAYYLKQSGCFSITYAPESGSPRLLHIIKKKVKLENMLLSMQQTHKQGVETFINMILGLPDETHKDVWLTLKFLTQCAKHNVGDLAIAIFRPYPGSVLFDRVVNENKLDLSTDDYCIESLLIIDSNHTGIGFNDNISPTWYKLYNILAFVAFYGGAYFYHPSKLFVSIRNIFKDDVRNAFELKISFWLKQKAKSFSNLLGNITFKKSSSVS